MLPPWGDYPAISISDNGVFVHGLVEHPRSRFVWVDRSGREMSTVGEPELYRSFDLSPDDRRLAVSTVEGDRASILSMDLERGAWTRLSFAAEYYGEPQWLDATRVVAQRSGFARTAIVRLGTDGEESVLDAPTECLLDDVSRDGRRFLCRPYPLMPFSWSRRHLRALAVDGAAPPELIHRVPATYLADSEFFPDGQYVAFVSGISGRPEVYVTRVGAPGERWAVTTAGALQPRWRADGRELFVLDLTRRLQAITVTRDTDGRLGFSTPVVLFNTDVRQPMLGSRDAYAVARDGQRFLLSVPVDLRVRRSIGVIHDWRALVGAAKPTS